MAARTVHPSGASFLFMDLHHEPIDAIKDWQIWYKQHQPIPQQNESMTEKNLRENFHNTTNATNAAKEEWLKQLEAPNAVETSNPAFNLAVRDFEDVLSEFVNELSPTELYKAFAVAATKAMEYQKKEYEKAKELVDLLSF
mgnify:FL=1